MTARDLDIKLKDLAERVGDECKSLRRLINSNSNNLNDLDTNSKESLVSAINELNSFNLNLDINSLGGITEQEVESKIGNAINEVLTSTDLNTNLSVSANNGLTLEISSSTGNNVTLVGANTLSAGLMLAEDKDKLDNITAGATKNSADSFLLDRGNHKGFQLASTITGLDNLVNDILQGDVSIIKNTFETVSQNLRSLLGIPFIENGDLISYTYTTYTGTIVKTFGYDADGNVNTITLSGDIPSGIDTIKNLDWSVGDFPIITYS